MRADLGLVLTLVMGIVFIVFSEVIGRKINDVQNMIAPRKRNAKRTRIICIIVGTVYVIYAAMSMFR
jgi:hypothetical protein